MKFRPLAWRVLNAASLSLVLAFSVAQTRAKPIHLKHGTLSPPPKQAMAQAGFAAQPQPRSVASGVYLVQVAGALTAEQRSALAGLGVDLLHYVPEDTYLARFEGVSLSSIEALPFVLWVGEYLPEYKVQASLGRGANTRAAAAAPGTGAVGAPPAPADEPLDVSVLFAPRSRADEIAAARSAFARVRQQSDLRLGTVLRGKLPAARIEAMANSTAVLWIEPAPPFKLYDEVASKIVAGDGGPGLLLTQVLGVDGGGVRVAVADTGLNNGDAETMHPDLLGRTPKFFWYGELTDAADEHSHGTHVAGIVAGDGATGETDENGALYGLGVAPGAEIIAQRIFDGLGMEQLPLRFEIMTRDATREGAVIGSNSWGADKQGRYDTTAMEFDVLVRDADALQDGDQPYIIEFSAGNAGPGRQTVGTPAVAKNVISSGASENDRPDLLIYADGIDAMADFSSRGPCEDGRIKPDVVAPGTWIASLKSASATDENAWSPISENYLYQGGTSQSGPHVSGAAALFVQDYRQTHGGATPSPALVKAALINSATDMWDEFGTRPVPNMDEGWGRVDLVALFDPEVSYDFVDQTALLPTGGTFERRVLVAMRDYPLKITMAYTDEPGFPGAIPALVNDLDLEVIGPSGVVYRGNQFTSGQSVPNAANADRVNNVEGVHLYSPDPGEYLIRVRARNVPQDARGDTAAVDQDFALVSSAFFAERRVGYLVLDRGAYTAPDAVNAMVIDTDLAGRPSTEITLRSSVEAAGETLVLAASGSSGVFKGTMATATGAAGADGRLQVAHGGWLEATYLDASHSASRTATALTDLVPPVLSNVAAAPSFGTVLITWTSDEAADSTVWYGTNNASGSLTNRVSSQALVTAHSVLLTGLAPGRTYFYFVRSADEAGNVTTNNNNGTLYTFAAPQNPPVLLVDQYQDDLLPPPPVTGYTEALTQLGVAFDTYDAATPPTLELLRGYPMVIFRVPEFNLVWEESDIAAISNYVAGGGSLMLASMEILSRLETGGFMSFITNVLQVRSFLTDENGSMGVQDLAGVPNDAIGDGFYTPMDYTTYDTLWEFYIATGFFPYPYELPDVLTPMPGAAPILLNEFGQVVGLRWRGPDYNSGRVVFLSFPFDAVPMGSGLNDRVHLLRKIMNFLVPEAPNVGSLSLDSGTYRLPAVVTAQLGESRLAGLGTVTASATSSTDPVGTTFTLQETPRQGLFVGTFALHAGPSPSEPGKLRASEADVVQVSYSNSNLGVSLSASATVDTVPPAITNVTQETEYITAVVYWDTSEVADALVQYGESSRLGQTAYDAAPTLSHAVTLIELAPDRTYYYRVISRDLAGNEWIDDNGGALYKLRTLAPLLPPWSDDMNSGPAGWTVLNAEGSQGEWTWGTPSNPGAHSPPGAWGSNLKGEFIDLSETLLISPAFYLTNGNTATLRFWHNYDFTPLGDFDFEFGYIEIVANNSPPEILAQYGDVSGDWVQEEIDLTRYLGKLVYIVWHYFLFALDMWPRPGWSLDDVEIAVSQVSPGTIVITNNLSQARWLLSGSTYLEGHGLGTVISNAGPGTYLLEFLDVPYYTTPAPQSQTLASGSTVTFEGRFGFPDSNNNSMSDLWETAYFNSVSPERTMTTDSDGDGQTDYAEFAAGTNPTDPRLKLMIEPQLLPNQLMNVTWTGAQGRSYLVEGSADGATWAPVSDWIVSTSTNALTVQVDPPPAGAPYLFRLRALP